MKLYSAHPCRGRPLGLTPYMYGNPLRYSDPKGLDIFCPGGHYIGTDEFGGVECSNLNQPEPPQCVGGLCAALPPRECAKCSGGFGQCIASSATGVALSCQACAVDPTKLSCADCAISAAYCFAKFCEVLPEGQCDDEPTQCPAE